MSMASSEKTRSELKRLQQHFAFSEVDDHGKKWDELWEDSCTPWDRGRPSPALVDLLNDGKLGGSFVSNSTEGKRRKRALVPGCGRGYDILLLSAYGYDAYGLEISATALNLAKECEKSKIGEEEYRLRDSVEERGRITWLQGDFFKDDFLKDVDGDGTFDLIYDYTFLSALPPEIRPSWARRYCQLLSPNGHLVCLEWPTFKPEKSGGPPWALPPKIYLGHLPRPGQELPYSKEGELLEDQIEEPEKDGLHRIAHFQPKRTHPAGIDEKGNIVDWISIWAQKAAE